MTLLISLKQFSVDGNVSATDSHINKFLHFARDSHTIQKTFLISSSRITLLLSVTYSAKCSIILSLYRRCTFLIVEAPIHQELASRLVS